MCSKKKTDKGLKQGGENLPVYSLEVNDVAGNRLRVEKEPLRRPVPEKIEVKPSEEKRKVWVEDF
ncbi:MAG: hypothetical protein ACYTEL_00700 [Planctomycetota bacterium]